MSATWDTSEITAWRRDLAAAPAKLQKLSELIVAKTALDTVAGSQAVVVVRTGHLKGTIGKDIDPDGLGFEAGPWAEYGHFVEDGTENADGKTLMPPRPYMKPGFERAVEPVPELLAQAGERALS